MNKKFLKAVLAASVSLLLAGCMWGTKPSEILAKQIKNTLGKDVSEYQSLTYPTNSFGIATSYTTNANQSTNVSDTDFLCSTWACLDTDSSNLPKNDGDLMRVKAGGVEYAQIGTGAPITLSSSDSVSYAFNILLPKIEGILNLGLDLKGKDVTNVDLRLGKATKRLLSKPDFESFISANSSTPTHNSLRARYVQGSLTVVVADVIIESIEATVKISSDVTPKVDAKLATIPNGIVSDATSSFQITKSGSSTYSIKTTEPVVALRLLKTQPGAQQLGVGDWSNWIPVNADDPTLNAKKNSNG